MATTTNWSITYPTTANNITPLATHFANLASSTDTALTNVRNQSGRFTGTNAQRLALTAATGRTEGTEFYTTDTDRNWLYDGSTWVNADNGMYVITPASAPSGFTVGADGSLVASNLSTGPRNFDNIFSSRFRNYRVEITINRSTNGIGTSTFQFRSGSSTISGNGYYMSTMILVGGVTSGVQGSAAGPLTSIPGGIDSYGLFNATVLDISNPFVAEATQVAGRTTLRGGYVGDVLNTFSYESPDSMTGISINFGQTITSCRIRFYGLV